MDSSYPYLETTLGPWLDLDTPSWIDSIDFETALFPVTSKRNPNHKKEQPKKCVTTNIWKHTHMRERERKKWREGVVERENVVVETTK